MLIRLITVISLILFMLLMLSGVPIDVALYRGLMVFLILFSIIYLAIFLLNILREGDKHEDNLSTTTGSGSQTKGDE
jgi:uncharacterized membrane protein